MRRRWTRPMVVSLLAASWLGCSDSTGPRPTEQEMSLDFCASNAPIFFAYQNEGGVWTPVTGDAANTFTFAATDKVAITYVQQVGSSYTTEVIYATRGDLEPLSGTACTEQSGTRTLNGSVTGAALAPSVWVTMGRETRQVFGNGGFTISNLPSSPLDLVANRDAVIGSTTVPDRVIVRRGINLTSGSTIPALDFASSEAVAPTTSALSITGMSANEFNSVDVTFSTPTVVDHDLYYQEGFTTSPQTIYSVPSSQSQSGDFHTVDLYAEASSGAFHGLLLFYRVAADRAAPIGPLLSTPTFSSLSSTQTRRMRMTLPVQTQYGQIATAVYTQQGSTTRTVFVTGTEGFFNSPATWTLDMPDLGGISGFPTAELLQNGVSVTESASAYGGSPTTYFGGAPAEGEILRYAGTASVTTQSLTAALRAEAEGSSATRSSRPRALTPFMNRRSTH